METKLCRHNQKEVVLVHYTRVYLKEVLKNDFVYVETRREFILSITFKAIDSPERLSSKIHPRYFTFACCLISMPLYTIFKGLALRSLCLVPNNIDFVLSCPKSILNLLSTNQLHKLEKSPISCFSVSISLLSWKNIEVSSVQSNESLTTAWGKSFM